MKQFLFVFLGGGLGSMARFGVSLLIQQFGKPVFPIATLTANFLSCIVLGLAAGIWSKQLLNFPYLNIMLIVGFCGGFSTFSTFSLESLALLRDGNYYLFALNILLSLILCISVLWILK
jgi:CrcB protein